MVMHRNATFNWPVRVYYEDTDAGGVVYHSNYLNFMERARTEWLRALGFEQPHVKADMGVIIVVHSMQLEFKSPAYFNDLLDIHCKLTKVGRGSIEMEQQTMRENTLLIKAQVKLAFVNADTFKPLGIPAEIKAAMLPKLAD
jgi:acyl-CoA thioester hydrolase